jgi:hypothetical protein
MFGHDWEPGKATIVARKEIGHSTDQYGNIFYSYEYVADVQPDGGAAVFRATMGEPFNETGGYHHPVVGEVVTVKCDPRHQKAKIDAAAMRKQVKGQDLAFKQSQSANFDALAGAAPGTSIPGQAGAGGPIVLQLGGISGNPDQAAAQIQQALASGGIPGLEQLKAQVAAQRAAAAAQQQPAAPAGVVPADDSVERLQKLGDLHARGVLTDAEFTAAKAKVLGDV